MIHFKAFFTAIAPPTLSWTKRHLPGLSAFVKNAFLYLGLNGTSRARPLLLLLVANFAAYGSKVVQIALTDPRGFLSRYPINSHITRPTRAATSEA